MGKIVIEILHTNRWRKEHMVFDAPSVKVGRGYHNDVIIPDPHISAEHILIQEEGDGWVVEDLDSENGLYVKKEGKVVKQARLSSGDEIIIGKTRLRLVSPGHPVEPTETLVLKNRFLKKISHPLITLGIVLLTFAVYSLVQYLESSEKTTFGKLATAGMGVVIGGLIWASLWAFVGHLIKHKSQFSVQLTLTFLYALILLPLNNMCDYSGYYTNMPVVNVIGMLVLFCLLFSVLLVFHLGVATNLSRKKRVGAAIFISFLIISVTVLSFFAHKGDFDPNPDIFYSLKPPIFWKIRTEQSADQFLQDSGEVFSLKSLHL